MKLGAHTGLIATDAGGGRREWCVVDRDAGQNRLTGRTHELQETRRRSAREIFDRPAALLRRRSERGAGHGEDAEQGAGRPDAGGFRSSKNSARTDDG